MFKFIKEYLKILKNKMNEEKSLRVCRCSCKCSCGNILNINAKCENTKEYGLYKYTCNDCSEISYFHYCLAPTPLKFSENEIQNLIKD